MDRPLGRGRSDEGGYAPIVDVSQEVSELPRSDGTEAPPVGRARLSGRLADSRLVRNPSMRGIDEWNTSRCLREIPGHEHNSNAYKSAWFGNGVFAVVSSRHLLAYDIVSGQVVGCMRPSEGFGAVFHGVRPF